MATLSVQRRSSVAERQARQTKSPLSPRSPRAPDDGDDKHDKHDKHPQHHTTRRSSRTTPLLALDDNINLNLNLQPHSHHHLPHPHPQPHPHPHPPPRANSRKRRAHDDDDAPPGTRPPTKVTVTQPHGQLLRITNGVPTALAIDADQLPQGGVSTPATNGVLPAALNATPVRHHDKQDKQDKRSLRSHDGGSRLKSDLAIYFSNYDDIIAGIEKPPGKLHHHPWALAKGWLRLSLTRALQTCSSTTRPYTSSTSPSSRSRRTRPSQTQTRPRPPRQRRRASRRAPAVPGS